MHNGMNNSTLYSIIRSNEVKELKEWLGRAKMSPETIYNILGGSYEELHLKHIPLSFEMRFEVEWKLAELQFAAVDYTFPRNDLKTFKSIKIHLDITCEHIEQFLVRYPETTLKTNLSFILDAKFVVLHLSVLKRRLDFTYKKLPWEEIEFLMVIFLLTITQSSKIDVTYELLVDYTFIWKQLHNFLEELTKIKCWFFREYMDKSKSDSQQLNAVINELRNLNTKGQAGRKWDTQLIQKNSPQFTELYAYFYVVRDIYSLHQIQDYLNRSLAVDLNGNFLTASLVIQRTFQVMGEYLKNESYSPNISDDLYTILVKLVSKDLRIVMCNMRNTLTHSRDLNKPLEIEEFKHRETFANIQLELKAINKEITRVLYQRKIDGLIMFLQNINSDLSMEKVESLRCQINVANWEAPKIIDILNLDHVKSIVNTLWQEIKDFVPDRSSFNEILRIINQSETEIQETAKTYISTFPHIKHVLCLKDIEVIKNMCKTSLELLKNRDLNGNFEEMFGLLHQIYLAYKISRGFAVDDTKILDQKLINVTKLMLNIHQILKWSLSSISWIENIHKEFKGEEINFFEKTVDGWFVFIKDELNKNIEKSGDVFFDAVLNQKTLHSIKATLLRSRNDSDFLSILENEEKKVPLDPKLKKNILNSFNKKKADELKERIQRLPDDYGVLIKQLNESNANKLHRQIECLQNFISKVQIKKGAKLIANAKTIGQAVIVNNMKQNYSNRLLALKSLYKETNSFKLVDANETLVAALEILILDLTECLKQVDCLHDNVTFLVERLPILTGIQLRNHLAHGNIATHILPYNTFIPLLVYATGLIDIPEDELIDLDTRWSIGLKYDWNQETVQAYIDRCQDIVKQQDNLFYAIENGCSDAAIELINSGVDIHAVDGHSNTALDIAILNRKGHFVTHILSNTKLDRQISQLIKHENIVKCFDVFKYLLENEIISGHSIFEHNKTLFHLALEVGQREVLHYLVDNNIANLNSKTSWQESALHLASKHGFLDIVLLALSQPDFDIDEKILTNGATALHLAIENGHYDIVDNLIKKDANIFQKTDDDLTPLQLSIRSGHEHIFDLLFRVCEQKMAHEEKIDILLLASEYSLKDTVLKLLKSGVNVNSKNGDGIFALWTAAAFGHANITELLLLQSANVDLEVDQTGSTALHIATRFGHIGVVDTLLTFSANVNAYDKVRQTPLHSAFCGNHLHIIETLLCCKNIIVNPFDISGMTPYHTAAEIRDTGALKLYIEKFPKDIDILTKEKNESALHLAVGKGLLHSVQLLLDNNANVNSLTAGNASPLHYAIQRHGYNKIVEILVQNDAKVNLKDTDGNTPLHVAVLNQNEDIVNILLAAGADVSISNNTKYTPLHTACMNPNSNIVKMLVSNIDNVNIFDDNEFAPLHYAASRGFLETVQLLLAKNADVNHLNIQKNSALHFASFRGHEDVVELLVKRGAYINVSNTSNVTPILMAIMKSHQGVVKFLHQMGATISETIHDEFNGTTLLLTALQQKNAYIAKLVLESTTIFVDFHATTTLGETPLHLACNNGFQDCVEKILSFNPDVNMKTKIGQTPLHFAAYRGYDHIVEKLMLKSARVDEIANLDYPTPLSCAVRTGSKKTVQILLKYQTDVNVQCYRSTTLLQIAILQGFTDIAKMLLKSERIIVNTATDDNSNVLHFVAIKGNVEILELLLNYDIHDIINGVSKTKGETPLHCAVTYGHKNIVSILLKNGANCSLKDLKGLTAEDHAVQLGLEEIVQLFKNWFLNCRL